MQHPLGEVAVTKIHMIFVLGFSEEGVFLVFVSGSAGPRDSPCWMFVEVNCLSEMKQSICLVFRVIVTLFSSWFVLGMGRSVSVG